MSNYFVIDVANDEGSILFSVVSIFFYNDHVFFVTDDSEFYDFPLSNVRSFRYVPISSEG